MKLKSRFLLFKVDTIVILPILHCQRRDDNGQAKGPDMQECGVFICLGDLLGRIPRDHPSLLASLLPAERSGEKPWGLFKPLMKTTLALLPLCLLGALSHMGGVRWGLSSSLPV